MSKLVKSSLAAAAVALVASGSLTAQTGIGIKAGASFGDISNTGVLPGNLDGRRGFAGGVAITIGGAIGVGAEALYVQRGAKSATTGATSPTRLDYIDIPVYLRLSTPTGGVRLFGYAGPQFSKEVRCKNASAGECLTDTARSETDFAGVVGAGLRLGTGTGLSIEGRYVYGLKDLKLDTVTSSSSYKTRTFLILAGLSF